MPHILIDHDIEPALLQTLAQQTGQHILLADGELGASRSLPESQLKGAVAMLCSQLPENHELMTSLQWVQLTSAGFAQIEDLGLSRRQISVCTASGVNDIPIAEWAVMMMLALTRCLPEMFHHQTQGIWDRSARFQTEIRGKTLGIWGFGGIGRETARLAAAMGLKVHVLTRTGRIDEKPRFYASPQPARPEHLPQQVFAADDAVRFCESLDFLMLAIPGTADNLGLIDEAIFNALPSHAFLLNPARGKLVDESALLHALRTSHIAGAALDTHFAYPLPPEHPLWQMPNVILTPHISGSSQSTHYRERLWQLFSENLRRWQRGEELLNGLPPHQVR